MVGSLFTSRLVSLLAERLPATAAGGDTNSLTPAAVQNLPAQVREVIVGSYSDALAPVFLYMVPLAIITFVLLLFVREDTLATTIDRSDILPESMDIDPSSSVYLEGQEPVAALEGRPHARGNVSDGDSRRRPSAWASARRPQPRWSGLVPSPRLRASRRAHARCQSRAMEVTHGGKGRGGQARRGRGRSRA